MFTIGHNFNNKCELVSMFDSVNQCVKHHYQQEDQKNDNTIPCSLEKTPYG